MLTWLADGAMLMLGKQQAQAAHQHTARLFPLGSWHSSKIAPTSHTAWTVKTQQGACQLRRGNSVCAPCCAVATLCCAALTLCHVLLCCAAFSLQGSKSQNRTDWPSSIPLLLSTFKPVESGTVILRDSTVRVRQMNDLIMWVAP